MAKIVSVYIDAPRAHDTQHRRLFSHTMAYGRWLKIAEALQRQGHQVDVAIPDRIWEWHQQNAANAAAQALDEGQAPGQPPRQPPDQPFNMVPLSKVDWHAYDVVKTVFHKGFETLSKFGGADHPFIISKLGSVVGPEDRDGIYFYGEHRRWLYETQCRISETSRYVTVLSEAARSLWIECHGRAQDTLLVPGGVDDLPPDPTDDPYPDDGCKRCIFAGNIYGNGAQAEANRVLIDKLNRLGEQLRPAGVRVYLLGDGDISRLNPDHVTNLGAVSFEESWDYLYHADVGIVVSAGSFMHNNESSKIYHYLRAGLPVVSESGFPNDHVVLDSGGGLLVNDEDMVKMAASVRQALDTEWDVRRSLKYVRDHHSWDSRAEIYRNIINTLAHQ